MNTKWKRSPNTLSKSKTKQIISTLKALKLHQNSSENKYLFIQYRSLQMQLNQIKSACTKINSNIQLLSGEVNDKMVKKFGMKIDFDEMEEAVLTRLLMTQTKKCDDANEQAKQIRQLKVPFFFFLYD